ncbi:MAG: pseudouridine synthase, partial [Clostridia bacterium]|nr:pseudouridine synthase [Clostridia bacterium]
MTEPDGVLILDKPDGMTSHDCVAIMRRLFHTRKVGHTGTLDPMATGVLPILLGRAAKAAEYLTAEDKHYIAGLRLGLTTDTEDITG